MLAIVGIIIGSIGAVAGAAAAVYTVRASHRLTAAQVSVQSQTAGQIEDHRLSELRDEVDDERKKRYALEAELGGEVKLREALERRVARLEAQVRSLGAVPVNGA